MINFNKEIDLRLIEKAHLWLSFFILILIFNGCQKPIITYSISGKTMGTLYSIKIVEKSQIMVDIDTIQGKIDSILQEVNQQMSTYIIDSEINQFNRFNQSEWFPISDQFFDVIANALEVSDLTKGTFDFTIGPLIELWGFNNHKIEGTWAPPNVQQLNSVLASVGYKNIILNDKNSVKKLIPDIQIDLNAIAKGYGVDIVFDFLNRDGYKNILVEIGGEVRCQGFNENGKLWNIGIDKPLLGVAPGSNLQTIISLDNCALATSGDYRNYFLYDDKIYSHTINPLDGYPTNYLVASASVKAPNCMFADALATALMIMGKEGLTLINSIENIDAMLLFRDRQGNISSFESDGW